MEYEDSVINGGCLDGHEYAYVSIYHNGIDCSIKLNCKVTVNGEELPTQRAFTFGEAKGKFRLVGDFLEATSFDVTFVLYEHEQCAELRDCIRKKEESDDINVLLRNFTVTGFHVILSVDENPHLWFLARRKKSKHISILFAHKPFLDGNYRLAKCVLVFDVSDGLCGTRLYGLVWEEDYY